jgi:hypothetical protein
MYGVSTPTYSTAKLRELEAEEQRLRFFEGTGFNKYDAQQQQRKMEVRIRELKDSINVFEAAQDIEALAVSKKQLRQAQARYRSFSTAMGLDPQHTRTFVVNSRR